MSGWFSTLKLVHQIPIRFCRCTALTQWRISSLYRDFVSSCMTHYDPSSSYPIQTANVWHFDLTNTAKPASGERHKKHPSVCTKIGLFETQNRFFSGRGRNTLSRSLSQCREGGRPIPHPILPTPSTSILASTALELRNVAPTAPRPSR